MLRLIRLLTIVIACCTVLGMLVILVVSTPVGRAQVTAALGSCPSDEVREGQKIMGQFPQMRQAMQQRSHKVGSNGKFEVWNTPQGEFWYNGPLTSVDAFVLAEEEFDI